LKISFYASIIDYTNGAACFEAKKSSSIRELIDELGDQFGNKFKEFLLSDNTCFFLVDGKGIINSGGLNTKINPDDKIEILPFVEAG